MDHAADTETSSSQNEPVAQGLSKSQFHALLVSSHRVESKASLGSDVRGQNSLSERHDVADVLGKGNVAYGADQ